MALFEITKRGRRPNYALIIPAGADYKRGIAFQESATEGTAELANGAAPIVGFITRDATQAGPILDDVIYPGKIQLPFKSGEEGSFEYAEEVEAEGGTGSTGAGLASYVDTVTAGKLISGATPLRTMLSFNNGMFCVAVTGQTGEYSLVAIKTAEISGNVRIKARRLNGELKP